MIQISTFHVLVVDRSRHVGQMEHFEQIQITLISKTWGLFEFSQTTQNNDSVTNQDINSTQIDLELPAPKIITLDLLPSLNRGNTHMIFWISNCLL